LAVRGWSTLGQPLAAALATSLYVSARGDPVNDVENLRSFKALLSKSLI